MTSRIIRCITKPISEYITEGEDYYFAFNNQTVSCHRVSDGAGSFMSLSQFKRCLKNGWIVFVDNLPEAEQRRNVEPTPHDYNEEY